MQHKKPIISQYALDNARNRPHRRLEASLDSPQGKSSKKLFHFDKPPMDTLCKYQDYCNVKKVLGRKQCYLEFTKTCRTFKYYQKYGK